MDLIFPKKLQELEKALRTLSMGLFEEEVSDIMRRDACVMRFIYTSELFWKTLKLYLREEAQKDSAYPRETARELRNIQVISDEETELGLQMIEDRNFCVHAYQASVAEKIFGKIPDYLAFMQEVVGRLRQ